MKKASFVCPGCGLPFDMNVRDDFELGDAEHPLCWNCVRAKLPSQLPSGFDVGQRVLVVAGGSEVEMVVTEATVARVPASLSPVLELRLVAAVLTIRPNNAVKP
jgi:hypothetical protein